MDKNLEKIATELFGKIRTQFPSIKLRDADNEATDSYKDARFFEFDYEKNGESLGTVTVSIDDNPDGESDGLVVMYTKDIVENQSEFLKRQWFRFLESLSDFASQRMMDFNIRDITKSNLDKRDRDQLINNARGDGAMTESKLWGTSKTSFQKMGEATLIVKHTKPVNYSLPAGRTMHIGSIYVENADGERFKYPLRHLNGARALATHVAHGGTSYDPIGQHIIGLSEELNKLRMFKNYVERNDMVSEAMGAINERVYERIDSVKKEILSLQNSNYYQTFVESFTAHEDIVIPEDLVNDWVDRLTIRSFNEELKNVFPYIYKLVGEEVAPIKELDADYFINETDQDQEDLTVDEAFDELNEYEQFINSIDEESALLNVEDSQEEAIKKLNDLMQSEMPIGPDGTNATQSLDGIIDDPDLMDAFKELGQINPEMDARNIIKSFLDKYDEEHGTDISSKISFNPSNEPAPVAEENKDDLPFEPDKKEPKKTTPGKHGQGYSQARHLARQGMAKAIEKAKKAGATQETVINFGYGEMTLAEAIREAGMEVEEFFTEGKGSEEIVEFIKSMFDENTGQFPKGAEGVKIAVEKEFGEGAGHIAERVIAELGQVFESKRILKLAGLI